MVSGIGLGRPQPTGPVPGHGAARARAVRSGRTPARPVPVCQGRYMVPGSGAAGASSWETVTMV